MKIHVYSICWNERPMIEYFLRHYAPFADRIVVYDEDSDDGTAEILAAHDRVEARRFVRSEPESLDLSKIAIFNECWKEARGSADYVIIVDCDEHVFHPKLTEYLASQKRTGVTLIPTLGFQMVSDNFPAAIAHLATMKTIGCPSVNYSKPCVFDPSAFDAINFEVGSHRVKPQGRVAIPASDEVMLLHYKFLGLDYVNRRYLELASRRGKINRSRTWGHHYTMMPEQIYRQFESIKAKALDIATPEFAPSMVHHTPRWRLQQYVEPGVIGPPRSTPHFG